MFRVEDPDVLSNFIARHPLGALIAQSDAGFLASHIPMIWHPRPATPGVLCGHVARANTIWKSFENVLELTARQELPRSHPWKVGDAPKEYVEELLRRIVAFRITLTTLIGRFKCSQHRGEDERSAVAAALSAEGVAPENIAELVRAPTGSAGSSPS
jgi:predicted FMN-binding regulatory protein PaiB